MEMEYSSYQKGLVLTINNMSPIDIINHLGLRKIDIVSIENNDLWVAQKKSRIEPTKFLLNRVPQPINGWYTYEYYFFSIDSQIFVSCPHPKLLEEMIESLKIFHPIFKACNIDDLCNIKFYKQNDDSIFIKRINAQILGEANKKVVSISLFGNDVIKSDIIKKILNYDKEKNREDINPLFTCKPIIFVPNSIKLTFDDGTVTIREEFSLNTDKFGNFSFYLKTTKDLEKLYQIIKFLHTQKLLSFEFYISPLKRNIQSLNAVEL